MAAANVESITEVRARDKSLDFATPTETDGKSIPMGKKKQVQSIISSLKIFASREGL
jgi:hypothetical protein